MIVIDFIELYHHLPFSLQVISIIELIALFLILGASFFTMKYSQHQKHQLLKLLFVSSNMIGVLTIILSISAFLSAIVGIRYYSPGTPVGTVMSEAMLEIEACRLYFMFFAILATLNSFYLWIRNWHLARADIRRPDSQAEI